VLDVSQKTSFAEAMIIASGRSSVHVAAIADRVAKALKAPNAAPPRIEGLESSEWVLIDAGFAIVHIFRPETRLFYNLEKLWGEGRPDEGKSVSEPKTSTRPRAPSRPKTKSRPVGLVRPAKSKAKPQ
jgi:ribosome-associated protein